MLRSNPLRSKSQRAWSSSKLKLHLSQISRFLIQIAPIEEEKRLERLAKEAAEEKLKPVEGEPATDSTEKPKTQ